MTLPSPLPLLPLVMVIQLLVSVAVQAQPVAAVTLMLAAPPLVGLEALVGATAKVHGATALWDTVTVCPATVSVPLREVVAVLAATV